MHALECRTQQGSGQIMDDDETGLVERLLRRTSVKAAVASSDSSDVDEFTHDEIEAAAGLSSSRVRRSSGSDSSGGGMGGLHPQPRRRGGGSPYAGVDTMGGAEFGLDDEGKYFDEPGGGGTSSRASRRGLGALISAFRSEGDLGLGISSSGVGEESGEKAESRPLLGRSKSSARIKVKSYSSIFVCFL